MKRKPDYVVNVWGDGKPMGSVMASMYSADEVRDRINKENDMPWRIPYRIRVYLKPPILREKHK